MTTEKADYMRDLRQEYKDKWNIIRRMTKAINPNPEYVYRKSLGGTLSHVIYILDEAYPNWRDLEKMQMPSRELGLSGGVPTVDGPNIMGR